MYDDAMSNLSPTAVANDKVVQRQKDNVARNVMKFLEGQNEYSGGMHAINANEIFEGMLTGDYAYQMAAGNERAGEVLKGITQTDNSLESEIASLFDNQAADNGLTDRELIGSLENENQKFILSTGLDYTSGKLSREEVMSQLEDNALFRDQDLSGAEGMTNNQFDTFLNELLTEEFIDTVVEEGQTSFHMASEEDWIEKWEEVIKKNLLKSHENIIKTNGEVNETLQRLEGSIDSLDKNLEKDIDLKNLNNGSYPFG